MTVPLQDAERSEKHLLDQTTPAVDRQEKTHEGRTWLVGVTSLFFILLQSACTAFMALSGLRLLIGLGSLAAAAAGAKFLDSLHGSAIRIPMESIAIAGSVINLVAIWRVRSLRARPSSQWRATPLTPEKKRAESVQILLAILTLLLVAAEWSVHLYLHHSI